MSQVNTPAWMQAPVDQEQPAWMQAPPDEPGDWAAAPPATSGPQPARSPTLQQIDDVYARHPDPVRDARMKIRSGQVAADMERIRQTPQTPQNPAFTEASAGPRGFGYEAGRSLVANLPAGIVGDEAKQEAMRMQPGEGGMATAGGIAGSLPGMMLPSEDPLQNALLLTMGAKPGAILAQTAAGRVAAPMIARVEAVLGRRAAAALENGIEGAGVAGAEGMIAHGSQEDWENDPQGAFIRTLAAGGMSAAAGGLGAAGVGAAFGDGVATATSRAGREFSQVQIQQAPDAPRARVRDPMEHAPEADLAQQFPELVKVDGDLPPRQQQIDAGNEWARQEVEKPRMRAEGGKLVPVEEAAPKAGPEKVKKADVLDTIPKNQEDRFAIENALDKVEGDMVRVKIKPEDLSEFPTENIEIGRARKFAEQTGEAPAVITTVGTDGKLRLLDGRHRILAEGIRAKTAGRSAQDIEINAVVPESWAKARGLLDEAPPAKPPVEAPKAQAPEADPRLTSPAKVPMAKDRADMFMRELPEAERVGWSDDLGKAVEQGIPDRALSMAAEINARPRALSSTETAGFAVKATELKNKHKEVLGRIAASSDTIDLRFQAAEARLIEQEFDVISEALRKSGTEKGRALASQKLTLDQDYSLIAVKSRAKAVKQASLSPKEEAFFARKTKQLEDLEKRIEELKKEEAKLTKPAKPAKGGEPKGPGEPKQPKAPGEKKPGRGPREPGEPRQHKPRQLQKKRERLEFDRHRTRRDVTKRIDKLTPKTFWKKRAQPLAEEIVGVPRSIMASMDFSAVFRQGGMIVLAHPVRASKSILPMFRASVSKRQAWKIDQALRNRPNAQMYERAGLHLSELDGSLNAKEEAFRSRLADKIPGIAGSQRAFTTFLNKLRADSFDAMHDSLTATGLATQKEAEAIANFINVATGRGTVPGFEKAGTGLSTVFFAPKLVASRFQAIGGVASGFRFGGGSMATRTMIATEYGRFLAGVGALVTLGGLAGASFTLDPRNSDFGKLVFGDTRIDILSGLGQAARISSRLATGTAVSTSGKERSIYRPDYGQRGAAGEIGAFLRTKLSPIASTAVDLMEGENVIGQEVTVAGSLAESVTPLIIQDVYDSMREHGIKRGSALGLLAAFGMSTQVHGEEADPVLLELAGAVAEKVRKQNPTTLGAINGKQSRKQP